MAAAPVARASVLSRTYLYRVYFGWAIANPRKLILGFRDFLGFALRKEPKPLKLKDWLGGLDSNQDNQIQNLMYCQLYDLPEVKKTLTCLTICDVRRKQVARRLRQ